ncbi:uncharacterized protein [Oscarella lobularis]|uniref:uncharacterized protein n=1 Tax=Oscarella lobularis TaxID=121494 RepID=UPI003313BDEF
MERERERTVVFIGEAGAGKSSCANSLARQKLFPTDEPYAKNVAPSPQKLRVSHCGKEYRVKIVDTVGLDDPDITTEEALTRLSQGICECKEGINAIFFVIGKRFTKSLADSFEKLWRSVFGEGMLPVTTILRTNYKRFDDHMAVEEDKGALRRQEGPPKKFFAKLGSRILYVDNNLDRPLSIQKSGERMLEYLVNDCKEVFIPPNVDDVMKNISRRVEKYRDAQTNVRSKMRREEEAEKTTSVQSAGFGARKQSYILKGESKSAGCYATVARPEEQAPVKTVDVKESISEEDVKKVLSVLRSQAKEEGNEFSLKAWMSASLEKGEEAVDMKIVNELEKILKKGNEGMDRAVQLLESFDLKVGQCDEWFKNAAEQNCIVM